jgi:hypothetical protein
MARFYFHLQTDGSLLQDSDGTDLPHPEAARQEAILAARDILGNAIKAGREKVPEAFVIADESGRKIAVVPLSAVLPDPFKT